MRHLLAMLGIVFLTACASQPASKPSTPAPPPVKVTGGVLVNSNGMTLYTYDRDVAGSGRSECNGSARSSGRHWGPAVARPAEISPSSRARVDSGWCYKGKPLYLFSGDANPGDNAGNG